MNNPLYAEIEKEAAAAGITLKEGKGGDADTSGKKIAWVMGTCVLYLHRSTVL